MHTLGHIFDGGSGWPLSPAAEKLARFLMDNPNKIHQRVDLADACGIEAGRSTDTYIAEIRKCLGTMDRIASAHGRGYAWIGEPVKMVSVVKAVAQRVPRNDEMCRLAVMTQEEVAKRLGLTTQAVSLIEKKALAKIRKKPGIKEAWEDMKSTHKRVSYDPFHEIWLFAVAENIAYQPVEEEEKDEDLT
jgi:DNA-binding XRE family transcriptional regulator